jgi:hypothetical protein
MAAAARRSILLGLPHYQNPGESFPPSRSGCLPDGKKTDERFVTKFLSFLSDAQHNRKLSSQSKISIALVRNL